MTLLLIVLGCIGYLFVLHYCLSWSDKWMDDDDDE